MLRPDAVRPGTFARPLSDVELSRVGNGPLGSVPLRPSQWVPSRSHPGDLGRPFTVQSGRQKELQVSMSGGWAQQLRDGYVRLHEWIRTTAPHLKYIIFDYGPTTANPASAEA